MLGTHVPRRIRPASARMNADAVGFSSTRKKKRAARGVVDTLLPSTATRETSSDYSRRVGRRDIAQELQRKARIRRIVAAVIAVAVVAVVAGGVGLATFFFRQGFSDGALIAAVVAANLMIAAAIVIDATKLRRLREDYQKGLAVASRSKAARAEQKRLRALERARGKEGPEGGSDKPVDEASMTFRERVAYRAKMSAQAANTKGSGI